MEDGSKKYRHRCARCLGEWETVLQEPKRCGVCGSGLWRRKPVLAPGGGRPRGSTVNASDPRRKYKEARDRGIEAMKREGKEVPAGRTEANGFDQEVNEVLEQLMSENPEMDAGTARGQAVKVVKERRRAREVEEARSGLVPIALEPVGPGGLKLTPAELAKRLGVKLGKEVE